jgi:hypothetical protein
MFAFRRVRELAGAWRAIDRERHVDRAGTLRRTDICGNDFDPDRLALLDVVRPFTFKCAITAAIEIGILGKMVEAISRAVEADGDIMAAVVCREPMLTPAAACADRDRA